MVRAFLIRYSLGFSVSACDCGSSVSGVDSGLLLEAGHVVLRHDVRIARGDSTLAGRIRVDGA